MADEMLRIAGRDPESQTAKAIKTDAEGNVNVQPKGSTATLVEDVVLENETETPFVSSFIKQVENTGEGDIEFTFDKENWFYLQKDEKTLTDTWLQTTSVTYRSINLDSSIKIVGVN